MESYKPSIGEEVGVTLSGSNPFSPIRVRITWISTSGEFFEFERVEGGRLPTDPRYCYLSSLRETYDSTKKESFELWHHDYMEIMRDQVADDLFDPGPRS